MAKEQNYPLIFASAFSQEAGTALNEASGSGLIPMSRILRSAVDLWRANHRWLMQQGFSALEATRYLLNQTEGKAQPPAQPQPPSFVPPPSPMPSPFAPSQPMNNGKPHAHP